jgi:hypothetical protein
MKKSPFGNKAPKEAKVKTYCDFGEPGRKTELAWHKTIATAMRQYARIWNIYGRPRHDTQYRVWQEEVL